MTSFAVSDLQFFIFAVVKRQQTFRINFVTSSCRDSSCANLAKFFFGESSVMP